MPNPDMSIWTGRVDTADGPSALRWHQMVKPLAADSPPGVVLIGFACDEGVRRNGGRVGTKDGPRAIRGAMGNLAWHSPHPVYDAGDVRCDDTDMEGAQSRLAEVVEGAIAAGHRPLVLGGGHETAWGTFQGTVPTVRPNTTLGIINFDAHLDLRADEPGNSGTPFNQMATWCQANGQPFKYLCVGASLAANTLALLERAAALDVLLVPDFAFDPPEAGNVASYIGDFVASVDSVYVSFDLDVLPAATMPAVSAPAPHGIPYGWAESLMRLIRGWHKNVAVDIVELNPSLDIDQQSARVAARLAWQIATDWSIEESPT
jgi:formiminoglutamase